MEGGHIEEAVFPFQEFKADLDISSRGLFEYWGSDSPLCTIGYSIPALFLEGSLLNSRIGRNTEVSNEACLVGGSRAKENH